MKKITLTVDGKDLLVDIYSKGNEEMVAITPICNALGLAPYSQARKLHADEAYTPHHMMGCRSDGQQKEMVFLPVVQVTLWLGSISTNRVTDICAPSSSGMQT